MAATTDKKCAQEEVVSVELPAPPGWKKELILVEGHQETFLRPPNICISSCAEPNVAYDRFVCKNMRNEIIFTSPEGEKINSKKQLEQYLKSHSGGPAISEFDWGTGETPRRSARISEKAKANPAPEREPPKKRRKKLSAAKKNIGEAETVHREPEKKEVRKQEEPGNNQEVHGKPNIDTFVTKKDQDEDKVNKTKDPVLNDAEERKVAEAEHGNEKEILFQKEGTEPIKGQVEQPVIEEKDGSRQQGKLDLAVPEDTMHTPGATAEQNKGAPVSEGQHEEGETPTPIEENEKQNSSKNNESSETDPVMNNGKQY